MKAYQRGNLDIALTLTKEEGVNLPKLLRSGKVTKISTTIIKSQFPGSLEGKTISLIYDPTHDRDNGVDCSEMIRYINHPPIPVYIADRGIQRLLNKEPCESAFQSYKLEIYLNI